MPYPFSFEKQVVVTSSDVNAVSTEIVSGGDPVFQYLACQFLLDVAQGRIPATEAAVKNAKTNAFTGLDARVQNLYGLVKG